MSGQKLLTYSGFCNGPCCVKSLSDRLAAEFLLLFVVSAGLPHHAIREDLGSPRLLVLIEAAEDIPVGPCTSA